MVVEIDEITSAILGAAIDVHRDAGPGLLESFYEAVLAVYLERRGLRVRRQQAIRFEFAGHLFDEAFRVDLLVEDAVIVEVKSAAKLEPVFAHQLRTYLRLTNISVGLVINFGGATLMQGVKRVVNNFPRSADSVLDVNRIR